MGEIIRSLDQALEELRGGNDRLLAGFGVIYKNSRGLLTPPGIFKHETRIEITGDGRLRMSVFRSLSDRPGAEAGVYEIRKNKEFVLRIVERLKSCRLDAIAAAPVDPAGATLRFCVTAGAASAEYAFPSSDAAATRLLKPLLNEFVILADEFEQKPLMTLSVALIAPVDGRIGGARVPIFLELHNSGTRGYWLRHPSRLTAEEEGCVLIYGKKPEARQDAMPEPLELLRAPLSASGAAQPDLWMSPAGRARIELAAQVHTASAGIYFMRAGYACYSDGPAGNGQPYFMGAAFSPDREMIVS